MSQQEKFSAAIVAACSQALDDGIFYEKQFQEFVLTKLGGPDFKPVLFEDGTIETDDYSMRRQMVRRLEEKLKALPRGTYAIAKMVTSDYPPTFESFIHDGSGFIRSQISRIKPTEQQIVDHQMGMDIYGCRKAVENDRWRAKEIAAYNFLRLDINQVYKNFDDNGTKYSKVTIVETMPEMASVKILLNKRGSKQTWTGTVSAIKLATGLNIPYEPSAMPAPPADDLFAMPQQAQADEADEQEEIDGPAPR